MAKQIAVERNTGHPWCGGTGYDVLFIDADTQVEMDQAVADATAKHWHRWVIGVNEGTGKPGGVLYKPSGITTPWHE